MVHSIELVFDPGTEAAIRRIWEELAGAGIPSQAPASRPHVTLAVAERIAAEVDELLTPLSERLPLGAAIGAPVLFGRANVVFARLVVPTGELLALHAEVHRLCGADLAPGPMSNSLPGQWTAHVTLARRVGWRPTRAGAAHRGAAVADRRPLRGFAPLGRQQASRAPDLAILRTADTSR